jgi:hypothetical protein
MKNISPFEKYEQAMNELIGLTISEVRYFEPSWPEEEEPEPFYDSFPHVGHFLDFGVELRMKSGAVRTFLWDNTFDSYGVGIYPETGASMLNRPQVWDVTRMPEWSPLIGATIRNAVAYWGRTSEFDGTQWGERSGYPADLHFMLDCDREFYLSTSSYNLSNGSLEPMADLILVVFERNVAAKYRLGSHGRIDRPDAK